jgi:ankyrin repeat protein
MYKRIREDKDEVFLRKMIEEKVIGVNDKNKEGVDPLTLAVDCELSIDTLEFLIKQGCDVNSIDEQGCTPLHYAVLLENEELVSFLV